MLEIELQQLPQICRVCLGKGNSNRLVRDSAKEPCRLCAVPFITYHWKLGSSRKKHTIICYSCAQQRDSCQSCLRDIQFSIPLVIRDEAIRIMYEEGGSSDDRTAVLTAVSENYMPQDLNGLATVQEVNDESLESIVSQLPDVTDNLTKPDTCNALCVYGIESDLDQALLRCFFEASIRREDILVSCRLAFYQFDDPPNLLENYALIDGRLLHFAWGNAIDIPKKLQKKVGAIVREYLRDLRTKQNVQ